MQKLLIVDDEGSIRNSLRFTLEDNYQIYTAGDQVSAVAIVNEEDIAIVLLDLKLGEDDGVEVLKEIKALKPEVITIMMTAYGTIESSVEAIKSGAFYYVTKPINSEELLLLLKRAEEYIHLNSKIRYLDRHIQQKNSRYNIVGSSKKVKEIFYLIDKVKDIDSNILITGESGTGKELVARAIHFEGKRKDKPFHVINCSAMPANLLESELFGFKKGSFTGAFEDRKGIIELSQGGSLFLDEIGDMEVSLQTKLLRVIQEKEIRPIGASTGITVDIRFISATSRDLKEETLLNRFRKDLFYRLNVIHIPMPPLRERKEDIAKLVEFFIKKYNEAFSKNLRGITGKALETLERYKFEGNVRELENIIERAVALTQNDFIDQEDLPEDLSRVENIVKSSKGFIPVHIGESMKEIEQKVMEANLEYFKGNRKKTSEALGMSERALRYKIKEYNL
ncbi:two component, sigma54 specific, transcriptional regulator, Fis family [Anaerovirgula multivorans]|uniref:Stage 0 sporulation protein A homolog n=1 Tax=Anaerovirgula multivorans TaxID=312168 RepID=A0A239F1L2_9FIRM|nr:sigma-54 dependent transcriptional regulator [Anaerovirgula multivorans]SNS50601.1 two component, sigma54 specific, transcriptional regulator, Fis family [Anaerovirgula multivorans]